jgi:hypothetical protein
LGSGWIWIGWVHAEKEGGLGGLVGRDGRVKVDCRVAWLLAVTSRGYSCVAGEEG